MKTSSTVILVLLIIVLVLAIMPALLIWSLNTLFLLQIPYTVKTILAAFVLIAILGATCAKSKSSK